MSPVVDIHNAIDVLAEGHAIDSRRSVLLENILA